jgi:hypothetical protein
MRTVRRRAVDGLLAGAVGGAVMSVSTNTEMRVRGRPPSRVPAQALERLLGLDLDEKTEVRLGTVGHLATSAVLGLVRAALDGGRLPGGAGAAVFTAIAYLPDFAIIPAVGDVPPPWRWTRVELGTSALHHAVYATGTNLAYARLSRR